MEQINTVIQKLPEGLEEINLSAIDPLFTERISIEQDGPVSIKLYLRNVTIVGISKAKISNLVGLTDKIENTDLNFKISSPVMSQLASYKINGQVILLPIFGEGKSNFTFSNLVIKFTSKCKAIQKDGETYMQIGNAQANIEVSRYCI